MFIMFLFLVSCFITKYQGIKGLRSPLSIKFGTLCVTRAGKIYIIIFP